MTLRIVISTQGIYRGPDRRKYNRSEIAEIAGLANENEIYVQFLDGLNHGAFIEIHTDKDIANKLAGDRVLDLEQYIAGRVKEDMSVHQVPVAVYVTSVHIF